VTFKVKTGNVTTTIFLVYRPPNSVDMAGLSNIVLNAPPNSIIIGDFNLPGVDWENGTANGRAHEFLAATEERFMEQLVDFPTQVKGNILDLVLTNSGDLVESVSAAGRLGKSDHTMLLVQLYGGQPQEKGPPQRLDWNRANWEGMREDLAGINWHNQLNGLETEAAWSYIKSTLQSLTSK